MAKKYKKPQATTSPKRGVTSRRHRGARVGHGRRCYGAAPASYDVRECEGVREGRPRRDQAAVLHHLARAVETERTDDAVVRAEQRDELPVIERAVRDVHVLVGSPSCRRTGSCGRTDPTTRTGRARTAPVPHRRGNSKRCATCDALFDRVRPVLESHHLAVEQRVRPPRDVARGDDSGRGEPGRIAHDAVVEREARAFEPVWSRAPRPHP